MYSMKGNICLPLTLELIGGLSCRINEPIKPGIIRNVRTFNWFMKERQKNSRKLCSYFILVSLCDTYFPNTPTEKAWCWVLLTVLVVLGSVSGPGLSPGSGSVVRVKVVVVRVVAVPLVGVVGVIPDHHVLPVGPRRTRHGAELRGAAGGGDPRGPPGRSVRGRVISAAEDQNRVPAARGAALPPHGGSVLSPAAQDAEDLPVVLPCQPPPERVGLSSLLSANRLQKTAQETKVRKRERQACKRAVVHG